ncbi:response regulator [Desulfobulbus alkaliphilus]|uniref:response regulator n=1 Tax=Desulfobulbus alkaliphilus TaxID=869814 RepID=UPI00196299ED|nr:response regulator [Desulfobulbus alkaliphilus]MBM9538690.1 response regulator [Desulfobulbus alkaliphilus]
MHTTHQETVSKPVVLIVDDQPVNIQPLGSLLREDYRVLVAVSGPKALEFVNDKTLPDIVLLDVIMPDMDGYEVCRRLKANARTHDIPVIFVTAMDKVEDEETGFRLGAVDYITKPFNPLVVRTRVRNQVNLKLRTEMLEQALLDRRILLDNIRTQVWYLTDTHTYGAVNHSHAAFFGVKPGDIAFRDMYHFMPEEEVEVCKEGNTEVFETGKPVHSKEWVRDACGNLRLLSIFKSPKLDDRGRVEYVVCSAEDITDRRRADEQMRLQSLVLNQIQDRVTITDLDGTITYVNEAEVQALSYSREEILEASTEIYGDNPDRGATQQEILEETLKYGAWRGEVVNQTIDGREIIMDCRTQVVLDDQENKIALVGVATDITEWKRAEAEIKSARDQYQSLVDNIPGITYRCMLDRDWTMLYMSDDIDPLTGYPAGEFVRNAVRTYASVIHPEDASYVEKSVNTAVSEGQLWDIEYRVRHKDGHTRWVHEKGRAVYNEDDSVGYLDGFIIDITPVKEAEKQHKRLQEQLSQAQKMESVGRLAGGVAHDFNNKLAIINGYAEMTMETIDPSDPLHEMIQEILTAGRQSADIVRQLLAFARQQTVNPVELDLNDTIASMLKMLQRLIGENIDLAWHPGNNLCPVSIDPSQVDQIMANLAVNARDAIHDVGKLTIETKNTVVDEEYRKTNPDAMPGRYVMLAVSDDGHGIEKEVQERMFDPYFTTKEIGKGTGLGLSTIYGILKQNKGFVNVYSEPGEGTTFKLYFPCYETEKSSVHAAKEPSGEVPMGSETILLVEDEPAILKMGREMIRRLGYTVLTAENPNYALGIAREYEGTIHLLITDVVMPEMNGRDLSSQLTRIHPDLKTLYMSGYTADVIGHHGVLDEGVQFIQKPFSLKDLAVKVREAIKQG